MIPLGLGFLRLASVPASIAYLLGLLLAFLYVYSLSIRDGTLLVSFIWRPGSLRGLTPKNPSVPGLIYRCMKNLKSFKVYEGDWWDNDPSAPWNAPEDPEPDAYIEYPEAKRDFITLAMPSDMAILKKKSDGSLWILDTTDIEEDHSDYLYYYRGGEDDDSERAEGYEDEEYASIATDMFKEGGYKEGKEAWDDRDGDRLFKLTPELAEEFIEEFVSYSKPRSGARVWNPNASQMAEYKRSASILSKAFPEA